METPLISIITPAYNAEKTIGKTVESVLRQTYQNFELLIVDDGSEDATLDIISSFSDSRIKVFTYPHTGHSTSRNRGIQHASGEYIALLDADDLWTPDKLEAQLNALQTHPEAAVAYSWTNYIDEADRLYRQGCHISEKGNVYAKLLLMNFIENGSNPLIRASALAEVGNFDESLINAPDWDLWLRLAARYSFVCVPSVQVLYRFSLQSVSTNLSGLEISGLQILERAFARAPESLVHLKKQALSNLYLFLTLRSAEVGRSRRSALTALRFLWQAIQYNPALLHHRRRLLSVALIKTGLNIVLSPPLTRSLLHSYKTWRSVHRNSTGHRVGYSQFPTKI